MSIFRDSTSSKLERRFTHSNGTPTTAPPIKGTADESNHHKTLTNKTRSQFEVIIWSVINNLFIRLVIE